MVESSEDLTTQSAPLEGAETSSKAIKSAEESSTVDGTTSEMSSSAPTESLPDDNKTERGQAEASETGKKEMTSEGNDAVTGTEKEGSNSPDTLPTEGATNSGDTKKKKNGNTKHGESEKGEKGSTNGGGVTSKQENQSFTAGPVVSSTKKTRPPFKYDPDKITLRFLFANKDGLTVTVDCKPGDTIGEVKGQLLSVWPEDLPDCSGGDQLRLICMGRGMLMPDSRTLEDCQVPVFKTHPTPVNVSVRPMTTAVESIKTGKESLPHGSSNPGPTSGRTTDETGQGCACIIQ